jgi:hypothetical protein
LRFIVLSSCAMFLQAEGFLSVFHVRNHT